MSYTIQQLIDDILELENLERKLTALQRRHPDLVRPISLSRDGVRVAKDKLTTKLGNRVVEER